MHHNLASILAEYGCSDSGAIQTKTILDCKLSILQIRDRLFVLGNILYEDLNEQIYVARIQAGYFNMAGAVVAMQLQGDILSVAGYAKEGIVKQHICQQAFKKLEDAAHGKDVSISAKRKWIFPSILGLIMIVTIASICRNSSAPKELQPTSAVDTLTEIHTAVPETTLSPEELAFIAEVDLTIDATRAYNSAVKVFNHRVEEYNSAILKSGIENIVAFPASLDPLLLVSEEYEDNASIVRSDNTKEKIAADTETVLEMAFRVEQATLVVKQITAPSGDWVIDRLRKVDSILGIQAVTEELDPDGLLGKEGGYSDCIYFTVAEASPVSVPGDSIVSKGTDAGGSVEIYPTLADAEARVEYLAGFDGTVLYSGSYAIVGTMVIRTSYKLSGTQQLELTNAITVALTALSQSE